MSGGTVWRVAVLGAGVWLGGCGAGRQPVLPVATAGVSGSGRVMGGQQPVSGSTLQLYTVGTGGDGSAATPLLPVNPAVVTDANGYFNITHLYSCANATQVYLVASGGNPGLVPTTLTPNPSNPNLVLMAALGPCSGLGPQTTIQVNELTTVAAVVALQPYMGGVAAVGSGTADAAALAQAMTLANELVSSSTGSAPGVGVPAGMAVPVPLLDTLADMLAGCVNSVGGSANDGSSCGTLFGAATLANAGTTPTVPATPGVPTDTATAILNLAIDPSVPLTGLLPLVTPQSPFQPALKTLPPANLRVRLHPAGGPGTPASGYLAFGDSNTSGAGTTPSVPPYPNNLDTLYPVGSPFANDGVAGSRCFDMNLQMFNSLSPQDSGNPVISDMIGTNDAVDTNGAAGQFYFKQCQFADNARAALPASSVVVPGAATTQSGVWSADATYASLPGLSSITDGSCVSATLTAPNGVFYVFFGVQYLTGSGGAFTVSVDGSVAADTVTGASGLSTTLPVYLSGEGNALHYVGASRYTVSAGQHTAAVCVTSATGSGNDVHVYGFGVPGRTSVSGSSAPRVLVGGVLHVQGDPNDTSDPGTGAADAINRQIAATLAGDGLNAVFVDVRSYVDPYLGMLSTPLDGCGVSNNPGLHVNDCGTRDLTQAFADALGLVQ